MKIAIHIDPAKAMRAGKNVRGGRHVVEVDPTQLTQAERDWLAQIGDLSRDTARNKRGECDLCLDPPLYWTSCYAAESLADVVEPTVEALRLAFGRAAKLREDADAKLRAEKEKETRELDERIAKLLAADPQTLLVRDQYGEIYDNVAGTRISVGKKWKRADMPYGDNVLSRPRGKELAALSERLDATAEALNASLREELARKVEQAQADHARAESERVAWIEAHGSTRLKRMLAEGIEHAAAYRDERLAAERPGWAWYQKLPGETKDPRNPPEEAFALLDEARKIDPAAKLQHYVAEAETDEDGDEVSPAVRGYVAEAEFLGRTIVFGVDRLEGVEA